MPLFFTHLTPQHKEWILSQPLFFTASAPLRGRHINVSPKGMLSTTFSILDDTHAAYIDATGSGIETVAHVYENGRLTVMFCSFDARPGILRLFCNARVVEVDSPEFGVYLEKMVGEGEGMKKKKKGIDGARAIILLEIWKVEMSCGYGVPILAAELPELPETGQPNGDAVNSNSNGQDSKPQPKADLKERTVLKSYLAKKVKDNAVEDFQAQWNTRSLDGLPGLRAARRMKGEWLWVLDLRAKVVRAVTPWETMLLGMVMGMGLAVVIRLVWLWYGGLEGGLVFCSCRTGVSV